MKPKTRQEAVEKGEKYYYPDKPCKNGHFSAFQVSGRRCYECSKIATRNWQKRNPEKKNKCNRKWWYNHRDEQLEKAKERRLTNKEKYSESSKRWREEHKDYVLNNNKIYYSENSERLKDQAREWRKRNPDKCKEYHIKRRLKIDQSMPKWADLDEIKYIYSLAKEKEQTVDHMVPLYSDRVCGLHVGDNLRVIPHSLNSRKSNRYWPDMWSTD